MTYKKGKRAMYLGRFHLFHSGHLECVRYIDSEPDVGKIVIVVGNMQYSRFQKNPFSKWLRNPLTYGEREQMIRMAVEGKIDKPFEIVGVPGCPDSETWFNIVKSRVGPDVFYTNCQRDIPISEGKGVPTRRFPPEVFKKGQYHVGRIRAMITSGDRSYKGYIPEGTKRFIETFDIENILTDFYERHRHESASREAVAGEGTK